MYVMTNRGWKLIGGPLQPVPPVGTWWRNELTNVRRQNDHDHLQDVYNHITGDVID